MSLAQIPPATPLYEVYAIKYAELKQRPASDIFLGADPHDAPVDMDYFVWLIRSPERSVLVDMGFNRNVAAKRGRRFIRCPGDGLRALSVDPAEIEDVIVTHLHYDHVGNYALFPKARFHLQDRELAFATGRMMRHGLRARGCLRDREKRICRQGRVSRRRRGHCAGDLRPPRARSYSRPAIRPRGDAPRLDGTCVRRVPLPPPFGTKRSVSSRHQRARSAGRIWQVAQARDIVRAHHSRT